MNSEVNGYRPLHNGGSRPGMNEGRNDGAVKAVPIGELLKKAYFHWPLYVLILLLSIIGAFAYLRYAKPKYSSTTKIYIKDDKKAGIYSRQFSDMDFGLGGGSKLVENEMEMIKSPLILKDVIQEQQFNIKYFEIGRVSNYEVYINSAMHLKVLSDSSEVGNYLFTIERQEANPGQILIKYQQGGGPEKLVKTSFGQPFSAGKDRFVINYRPALNINNVQLFQIRVDSIMQLAYRMAGELNTALVNKQASVFEMSYQDGVAKRTSDFLNAVIGKYNEYTLNDKNETALKTLEFIEGRLESLGAELNALEGNVETFKKSRGITEINESSKLILEQVKEADGKLNEANIMLSVYNQIDNYLNNNNEIPFTPLGNIDAALAGMINNFQQLKTERKRLTLSLQPENPILQNLDQQIVEAKSTIKNYIAGFKRNANTTKAGLQQKVNEIERKISQIPGFEREYISLKRQQSVKEGLYIYLLQKKEESAVSYASNIVGNKIISPAYIPTTPISPNKAGVLVGAIVLGFLLTSFYLYLKYLLNKNVLKKSTIEEYIKAPIIGEIFIVDKENSPSRFFASKERNVLTEQLQNLRMNLKFMLNGISHTPVLQITSSISGEGKSFLSAHLGNVFSANNHRVLLIELDLRKPKLSKSIGVDNKVGISNYLIGMAGIDEIIKKVPNTDRVFIIPSGPIPPNPVELIESEAMGKLLDEVKKQFDYIIIDTAPLGIVTDAKTLAPKVDCNLLVVRFNHTPKAALQDISQQMDLHLFKKFAVIFNGIDENSSFASSGYGYGHYGNGYLDFQQNGIKAIFKRLKQRLY